MAAAGFSLRLVAKRTRMLAGNRADFKEKSALFAVRCARNSVNDDAMDDSLKRETEKLIKSWMQYDEAILRDYLVEDVEDPRINVQSILTRHFLIDALFGDRFAALMEHELRFGMVMNWLLKLAKSAVGTEDFQAIHHALRQGADNAEGLLIPQFVLQTFAALPAKVGKTVVPNYLDGLLSDAVSASEKPALEARNLAAFEVLWQEALQKEQRQGISVLEAACGSANDYRFIHAYGLGGWLNYAGFDLCEKNIRNARVLFPKVGFAVGNVMAIASPDKTFDYCFAQDLLEHLSVEAMELAVAELCRVTRQGLCLGFFNMHEGEDHVVRPVDDYHWNTLSMARTRDLFEQLGFAGQMVHIDTFLKWRFGCEETHNKNAYTFVLSAQC